MYKLVRIGTRESQLAVWQATQVKDLLAKENIASTLVYIKSEGDVDLKTPLYEMGVQGIFTKSLDVALLNNKIDIAVHSMKDVPTQLANGISQAAVLKRGNPKDLLLYNGSMEIDKKGFPVFSSAEISIATSSIRRKAQWLHFYPNHRIENLRGNVNTRLQKLTENNWKGAIFAAAGLERINLRPSQSVELDWMLPAPAQGAIVIVCRADDQDSFDICAGLNDDQTALCAKVERDFLRTLLGGCSTPIAALARIEENKIHFKGNILTPDGNKKSEIEKKLPLKDAANLGKNAAEELLREGGEEIVRTIQNEEK